MNVALTKIILNQYSNMLKVLMTSSKNIMSVHLTNIRYKKILIFFQLIVDDNIFT